MNLFRFLFKPHARPTDNPWRAEHLHLACMLQTPLRIVRADALRPETRPHLEQTLAWLETRLRDAEPVVRDLRMMRDRLKEALGQELQQ